MADIIDARVMQKTGTLAEWQANSLVILEGEQAFVRANSSAQIEEFRVGNGTDTFNTLTSFPRSYSLANIDGFFDGSIAKAGYNKSTWDKVDNGGLINNKSADSAKLDGFTASFTNIQSADIANIIVQKADGSLYRANQTALKSFLDNALVPAGGSTNQVLAKNSNSNFDLKWVNQSGGGGSSLPEWLDVHYSDMTLTGSRYDNVLWAGFNPSLVTEDGELLVVDEHYDVLPTGGFVLRPGNYLTTGKFLRAVNFQTYLAAPAPYNGIVNDIDQEFNFTPAEEII